jgi:hypothetical protein
VRGEKWLGAGWWKIVGKAAVCELATNGTYGTDETYVTARHYSRVGHAEPPSPLTSHESLLTVRG